MKTFLLASTAGTLCQLLKGLLFPRMTMGQSHAMSVVLAGLAAAVAHFFVARKRTVLLRERDDRFRMLFYHNPLPMYVFDLETLLFLEVNDAAVARYGYSRREFLGMTILEIRPSEEVSRLAADLGAPETAFREAGAWRHHLKNGQIIWVHIARHQIEWKGRRACLVVAQNITESRRNEEALRSTEELFRTAFEKAPFGMCLTGLDGRFLQANAALCRMLGYTQQELKGGAWESITDPADIVRSRAAAVQLMAHPEESVELEKRYISKGGTTIWARLKISTVTNSDGRPSHWIGHIEDVTEQKRAKEELIQAKEAAEAASRAKSQFLANMSHEIRTPMNAIMGMNELALATPLTVEQRDYLSTVRTSGEALLEIINDILDFSKIEAGKFALNAAAFDVGQTLQEVLRIMAVPAHEKGLELLYENRAEFPDRLVGDPGRLRQVIVNLLGNAIKFTASGEVALAVLEAHLTESGLTLHLAVSDTGIGVAPEWKDRIFDAFVQADGSDTRSHGGTGLGLAICSRLVALMGGRMWVESELGRGSAFHFTANFGKADAESVPPTPNEIQALSGLSLLVIEGNLNLRRILSDMLRNWGVRPILRGSVSDARDVLREFAGRRAHFDAVLMDAHLTGLDDAMLTTDAELRPAIAGPRIAVINSLDVASLAPDLRTSGHYLVKPVTPANLREALLRAMGKQPEPAQQSSGIHSTAARHLRILLAEDNLVNQKVAARLVEKLGHSVEIASNGAQALAASEHGSFDLILMDIQMPVMNGYDAARAIRASEQGTRRHIPIVALTAHAMKEDRGICLQAGMDDYLAKPIHPRELASTLGRWSIVSNPADISESRSDEFRYQPN